MQRADFKIKRNKYYRRVVFPLQRSFLGRLFQKSIRSFRKSSARKASFIDIFFKKYLNSMRGLVLILLSSLTIAGILFLSILYSNISIQTFEGTSIDNEIDLKEVNLLIIEIDFDGGYRFIDNLGVLSINQTNSTVKYIGVDPAFLVQNPNSLEYFTIRSFLNNINPDEDIYTFVASFENLLGVRVDRYLVVDSNDLGDYIAQNNLKVRVGSDIYQGSDKRYTKGEVLVGSELNDYLSNEQAKVNSFTDLVVYNIEKNANYIQYIKYFFKSKDLSEVFKTDLKKSEIFNLYRALLEVNFPVRYTIIDSSFGFVSDDNLEKGLVSDIILINEAVVELMRDFSVLSEQAEIEIYNASIAPGRASSLARKIQNSGGNVIKFGNYNQLLEKTEIHVVNSDPKELENTLLMVNRFIKEEANIKVNELKGNFTGDIIIIIGNK